MRTMKTRIESFKGTVLCAVILLSAAVKQQMTMNLKTLALALCAFQGLLPLHAAVWTVTTLADGPPGSLRNAVAWQPSASPTAPFLAISLSEAPGVRRQHIGCIRRRSRRPRGQWGMRGTRIVHNPDWFSSWADVRETPVVIDDSTSLIAWLARSSFTA
jgi:hypothetical protein